LLERLLLGQGDIAAEFATAEKAQTFKNEIELEWELLKPALTLQFEQVVMMSAHYSYRNLSNLELQQYIDFLAEPRGQLYWKASLAIIDIYLKQFFLELVDLLRALKKTG